MIAQSNFKFRKSGFTLIELLIVIMIIAILASLTSVVMLEAVEDARKSRTRAQVSRINQMVMEKWEEFEYRQLPIRYYRWDPDPTVNVPVNAADWTAFNANGSPSAPPLYAAKARLFALRAYMRMEMPDRMYDILDVELDSMGNPITFATNPNAAQFKNLRVYPVIDDDADGIFDEEDQTGDPLFKVVLEPCSLQRRFLNAIQTVPGGWNYNTDFQGAECLYMILGSIDNDRGTGLDYFADEEIGDKDEDGLPEILDAWGNPINFIRWPAGFKSPMQRAVLQDFIDATNAGSPLVPGGGFDPDAFDPIEVDPRRQNNDTGTEFEFAFQPYLLVPLIYSAGPDEVYDIVDNIGFPYVDKESGTTITDDTHYSFYWPDSIADRFHPQNDPYFFDRALSFPNRSFPAGQILQMGMEWNGDPTPFNNDGDDTAPEYFDNITNQTQTIDE